MRNIFSIKIKGDWFIAIFLRRIKFLFTQEELTKAMERYGEHKEFLDSERIKKSR